MSTENNFVFTSPVVMVFPNLDKPRAVTLKGKEIGAPKYSANFLLPPDHLDLAALKTLVAKTAKTAWPDRDIAAKGADGRSLIGWPWRNGDVLANKRQATNKAKGKLDPADPTKGLDDSAFQRGKLVLIARSAYPVGLAVSRGDKLVTLSLEGLAPFMKSHFYSGVLAVPEIDIVASTVSGDSDGPDKLYVTAYLKSVFSTGKGDCIAGGAKDPNAVFSGYIGRASTESVGVSELDDEISL